VETIQIRTHGKVEFLDITEQVQASVSRAALRDGLVCVWAPHTTAGVIVNENADPDVCHDLRLLMREMSERDLPLRHAEGNSPAHFLSSLTGPSITILVEEGRLCLGTWQGVFFAEYDGPRTRQCWLKMLDTGSG
jgi:secondary thiamine-phosphate synthase enzyme